MSSRHLPQRLMRQPSPSKRKELATSQQLSRSAPQATCRTQVSTDVCLAPTPKQRLRVIQQFSTRHAKRPRSSKQPPSARLLRPSQSKLSPPARRTSTSSTLLATKRITYGLLRTQQSQSRRQG